MHWLNALDVDALRFVNQTLSNPVFDVLMPIASGRGARFFFFPALIIIGVFCVCKGGARARICALMLALILWPGDSLICNTVKHAVGRLRPFAALEGVRLPAGYGTIRSSTGDVAVSAAPGADRPATASANSMPSSHAANWFAATMILLVYYRRSWMWMLPLALLVSFSRIYNGVHYPSDVLAGAILGAGYAAAGMWAIQVFWHWVGRRWFPLWWEKVPSLLLPDQGLLAEKLADKTGSAIRNPNSENDRQATIEQHWLRLGYIVIAVMLLSGMAYLASGTIELSGDEAYQWIWSKHLALSYYSKPPLIAYTQWLGTLLWGDTELGVRFFSPVISAILGWLLLRFMAREGNARAGFFLLLIVSATPLMALGSILMTVDPLSVLFWTAAMISGWRAVQPNGRTCDWCWTGLWMGLGFLSKYTELFQWLCWVVFFILWKPARAHLRKPGPYVALLINALCAAPVLIWNQQHQWITVSHVAGDAKADKPWEPSLNHVFDLLGFLGKEFVLLNPVFFVAAMWAAVAFWRRNRHDPRLVYLFSMGAPLFLAYLLFTLHSSVLPNWIAPAVLPLFCLMVLYWDTRLRFGSRAVKVWLVAGLAIGCIAVVLMHDTNLVQRIAGRPLPPKPDPLTRVRAYSGVAEAVNAERMRLQSEGKPAFIIGNHYGITGLVTFYLPEARTNVADHPLVYCLSSDQPKNQFYFWPGYRPERKGENAIFVQELSAPPLVKGWPWKWLSGETKLLRYGPKPVSAPDILTNEFDSVTDLGLRDVLYRGRVFHTIQLFECRNLH